jgi:twinfilin-like protein
MSASVPMSVQADLRQTFNSGSPRAIKVEIQNESLHMTATLPKGGSESSDFDQLKTLVANDSACYLLVQLNAGWLIVTWVPDGVKVNDKMVYAATKSRLKNELGISKFFEEYHANDLTELSWTAYSAGKTDAKPYSAREEAVMTLNKWESDARKEFAATLPGGNKSDVNKHTNYKSSGYHSVNLPFTDSAKDLLQQLKAGTVNFVELKVNDAKDGIEGVEAKTLQVGDLAGTITHKEPRFFFFDWHTGFGGQGFKNLFFIYYCPDGSPIQLRMVYSTAKPTVSSSAESLVGPVKKVLEISEGATLTDEYLRTAMRTGSPSATRLTSPTSSGPMVNSTIRHTLGNAHPIYSMGVTNAPPSGSKSKRIIIPPAAAYGTGPSCPSAKLGTSK